MKSSAIKQVFLILALLFGAILFLFPFFWMLITSFKVPGTGDKLIYFPEQRISFRLSRFEDFLLQGFTIPESKRQIFNFQRDSLYDKYALPDIQAIQEALEKVLERKMELKEQQLLQKNFSPLFDLNLMTSDQLQSYIPAISDESAAVILSARESAGSFDTPQALEKIYLFTKDQVDQIHSYIQKKSPDQVEGKQFILENLENTPLRQILALDKERLNCYREYVRRYGISASNPSEVAKIPRFSREQIDSWKRYFFTNTLYTLSNYIKVLFEFEPREGFTLGRAFFNSFIVATMSGLLTIFLCTLAGYVFAKKEFYGKKPLYLVFWASMMVPGMMFLVPQYAIITGLDWVNTFKAMIIPHAANIFGLYLMKQYIEQIPHSLFEAAQVDGASEYQIFRVVIIPLTKPILATLFLMTFLSQWSNFLWQLIVNSPDSLNMTLPVTLALFKGQYSTDWTVLMAGSSIMLIPIVLLFLFTQKYFVSGITQGAVKE